MGLFREGQTIKVRGIKYMGEIVNPSLPENKMLVDFFDGEERTIDRDDVYEVEGLEREIPTYYQPHLTDEEFQKYDIASFEVYRYYRNAKNDFPHHVIGVYRGSDIENHGYIDDEEDRNPNYYVDVPSHDGSDVMVNLFNSFSKEDTIFYARLYLGADEQGRINLISQS